MADTLSHRVITDLRVMFARLGLFDYGSLLAELQIKSTWIDHIRVEQLVDDSLIPRFQHVEKGRAFEFRLNNDRFCVSNIGFVCLTILS